MSLKWHETMKQADAEVGADTIRPTTGFRPLSGLKPA